jgi:hypothetical protein
MRARQDQEKVSPDICETKKSNEPPADSLQLGRTCERRGDALAGSAAAKKGLESTSPAATVQMRIMIL